MDIMLWYQILIKFEIMFLDFIRFTFTFSVFQHFVLIQSDYSDYIEVDNSFFE